ncbi:hypothetical protein T440DRAFT_72018 [Plenodomus tracheiphilus IPT5]|uniref:Uncharacterized protein n=1 Tax=Plenodomus tracheiphilus IPT5 TaxID=1408161 RepID=A0A6A7B7Q0_9PLEO|nr:hypothetical protein T440DRAFT_72018 [Plenodomus tracheiphilus IPT5]
MRKQINEYTVMLPSPKYPSAPRPKPLEQNTLLSPLPQPKRQRHKNTSIIRILIPHITHKNAPLSIPALKMTPCKPHHSLRGLRVQPHRFNIFLCDITD